MEPEWNTDQLQQARWGQDKAAIPRYVKQNIEKNDKRPGVLEEIETGTVTSKVRRGESTAPHLTAGTSGTREAKAADNQEKINTAGASGSGGSGGRETDRSSQTHHYHPVLQQG